MAKDYAPLVATVNRLINEYGRQINLIALETTPADLTKPWQGNAAERSPAATTESVMAVFVEPSSLTELGHSTTIDDLFKTATKVCILGPPVNSMYNFNELLDGIVRYKIEAIEELKPGDTVILYYLGLVE